MKFKDAKVHDPRTPSTIYDWSQTYIDALVKLFELCDEGLYAFLETHGKLAVMKGSIERRTSAIGLDLKYEPSLKRYNLRKMPGEPAPTNQSSSWLDPFSSIREKKEEVRGDITGEPRHERHISQRTGERTQQQQRMEI